MKPRSSHAEPPASAGHAPPLWRQLLAVAEVVQAVMQGRSLTQVMAEVEPGLRPGVQALSYDVLRWWGRAQAMRRLLVARQPAAQADALLCTAIALGWRGAASPYPPFVLVDQAVEAAKRAPALRGQANFMNACLRRLLRERDALVAATDDQSVACWNHPAWWIEALSRQHPAHWQTVLEQAQTPPPMVLRVNSQRMDVEAYLTQLQQVGLNGRRIGPSAIQLNAPRPVDALPGFRQGWVSVQDAGAQLAAPLLLERLTLRPAARVLDACAAPGGKTAHLLELDPSLRLTALEIDPQRAQRIGDNLQRLALTADVRVANAAQPAAWWDGVPFDAVLLDAPCSASGIVRRHPDIRWLRRAADIDQLTRLQDQLLHALWPVLAPGGLLLYCTCSVFLEEGEQRIEAFVRHHKDVERRPAPGHLLPSGGQEADHLGDNARRVHDGFFYALLQKKAAA